MVSPPSLDHGKIYTRLFPSVHAAVVAVQAQPGRVVTVYLDEVTVELRFP